jgi:hypothetical protein
MGPGWTLDEPQMDIGWTPDGHPMDPAWSPYGPRMEPGWITDGARMDPPNVPWWFPVGGPRAGGGRDVPQWSPRVSHRVPWGYHKVNPGGG